MRARNHVIQFKVEGSALVLIIKLNPPPVAVDKQGYLEKDFSTFLFMEKYTHMVTMHSYN